MKYRASKLLIPKLMSIGIVVCSAPSLTSAADRIRVGLNSFTPINAALCIADDKGLFKKNGIEAEVVVMAGAASGGLQARKR